MAFQNSVEENIMGGGGMGLGGFGGGSGCGLIIIVLLIMFVLFKDDGRGRDGGYGGGYGMPYPAFGGGCGSCGPCVQPTFKDESNWEQDYHFCKEINGVDKDVIAQGCMDREATHCEGEKTRALIQENYVQSLRDQLAEKNDVVMTLKQEMFTEKKFDQLAAAIACTNNNIDKMFCKTDRELEKIQCEIPHRPPVWAECVTPLTRDLDKDCREFPRRGRFDNDLCGCAV